MRKRKGVSARHVLLGLCLLAFVGTCSCRQAPREAAPAPSARVPQVEVHELPVTEAPPMKTAHVPNIRVAVLKDAPAVRISGGRGVQLLDASGKALQQMPDNAIVEVKPGSGGLLLNGAFVSGSSVTLQSSSAEAPLLVNAQETAPAVAISRTANAAGLTIVAMMDVEEYLKGVLAGEVPFEKWHPEALKAQAVASRTFALYQAKKNSAEPYDVECTVMSQVFRTGYRDHPILKSTVDATRGLVLTANGAVFSAYFHSTCGGQTADSHSVFPDQPGTPPTHELLGATCPFCCNSPHYRWNYLLKKDGLAEKLRLPPQAKVTAIEFLDASGRQIGLSAGHPTRAIQVRLRHTLGTAQWSGNQFRLLVGAKDLKSLLIDQVVDRPDGWEISGGGFGHGVGLCQFGSEGMAAGGYPYTAILGLYYRGAALTKLYP